MEEEVEQKDMRHHQNGRDSSSSSAEEESGTMSLSPSLPRSSPPRSQQIQQQNSHSHNHSSSNSRTTNFFIDNILRPDFGCRKEGCRALRAAAPFLPAAEVRGMAQGPPGTTIATSAGRENVNPLIANSSRPMVHGGSLCLDSNCSSDSTNSSSSSSSSSSTSSSTSSSPSSKQGSAGKQGETASGGHRYADSPSAAIIIGNNNNHHHHGGSSSPPSAEKTKESQPNMLWPAWVYCTRYSDRPSSGPRTRKLKKKKGDKGSGGGGGGGGQEDKRPRTAFTAEQLQRLKAEFTASRYITEQRRQSLATELGLNESQIKIWFQNKRAKIKKAAGYKNGLALQLMAQGLYNHSTTTVTEDGGCGGGGPGEDSD